MSADREKPIECTDARRQAGRYAKRGEWAETVEGYVKNHVEEHPTLPCRAEYDETVRAFREVGEASQYDDRRNSHLRRVDYETAMRFAREEDLGIVPLDDPHEEDTTIEYADTFALPTARGIVPLLAVFAGDALDAADKSHIFYHVLDEYIHGPAENSVVYDGGTTEWGDPAPFGEDEDGEPLFWTCPNPDCSTQKTTPAKAAAHCAGEDADSSDTDADEPATGPSSASEPTGPTAETPPRDGPDPARVRAAVGVVLRHYHGELDREIGDHVGPCDHDSCGEPGTECDRPATARAYFRDVRGWSDDTIESALLGWGPADDAAQDDLAKKLVWDHGFTAEEIRATGLFHEDLSPKWQGRYSLPYLDADGRPVYGISRCTDPADTGGGGAAGYDGHPADSGYKYDKHIKNKEYAHPPDEPIFGLGSVEDGEPLLVAGGIADAISLHQAGYPCVSPVTTVRFKGPDLRKIVHLAWERNIPRVYVVNDAEPPTSELKELDRDAESVRDGVNIRANGEGRKAAINDARDFLRANIPTFFVDLPRPASFKVDPDDAVLGGWGDFDAMLASAKPAEQNDEYQKRVAEDDPRRVRRDGRLLTPAVLPLDGPRSTETPTRADAVAGANRSGVGRGRFSGSADGGYDGGSAVWGLDFADVAGTSNSDRGDNPAGHHGNSHGYYTTFAGGELGYDHKDKVTHNALTYLLVDADERDAANAEGELSDREKYVAWKHAKAEGDIPADDPIPLPALFHVLVASEDTEYEADDWVHRSVEDGSEVGSSDDDPRAFDEDVRFGLPAGGFNTGLDLLDEAGIEHGREHIDAGVSGERQTFDVKPCRAPAYDPVAVDTEQRRTELEGPRLEDWFALKEGRLMMFGDEAGDGKTTSSARGLAAFDRPFVTLLPKHENCREFQLDDAKPEVDHHHKGAAQPYHNCCMDAKVAADEGETPECIEHGHPADWERMCPIYHLDTDHPVRQRYDALLPEVGVEGAHEVLDLKEYDWHGKRCYWQESHDRLEDADRVVTVHNYLTQKTVRGVGDVVLDDVQGIDSFTRERQFTVEGLTRAANRLDRLAGIEGTPAALDEFARFAHDLVGGLTGGLDTDDGGEDHDEKTQIEALDPPELPDYKGWQGEPLAQAKLEYNMAVVRDMKKDEWDGEPLCIDALLAAAVHAGLDRAPAMVAAALPATLDNCPRCETRLEYHGGAAGCPACGWDERYDPLTKPYDEAARAQAWLDHEGKQREDGQTCLAHRALPLRGDLPAPHRTLWLDATPTPELVGLLFGIDPDEDVVVTGNEPRALNAEVTQITNGQYHRGTIARGTREGDDHSEYGERLRARFQTLIEARCRACERVLVAGHKKNRHLFDLPENAEWMHYHAGRGLDRSDYDAVVMVGAPHVPEDALRRDAELLAQGRDDVRVGGREFGTRRNEQGELAANPPIYRKYLCEDVDGRGEAGPTKGYSGLMGTLFRACREDELHQIGHRIRPGQADEDEPKHIDLLTNVPTDLPVDTLTDLETLTEPLYRQAGLTEGAMDMQAAALDALDRRENGQPVAGVRPGMLAETDEDGDLAMKAEGWRYLCRVYGVETRTGTTPSLSTIYDWLDRLDHLDLLHPEEYEQREGRTHSGATATLNLALQYLSYNVKFKVDVAHRFRRFVADGASAEVWLDLLAEAFDAGDGVSGGHPPPDPT